MKFKGDKFHEIRKQKGYTLDAITEKTHISRTSFYRWSKGLSTPTKEDVETLAKALDVTADLISDIPVSLTIKDMDDAQALIYSDIESPFTAAYKEIKNLETKAQKTKDIVKMLLQDMGHPFYVKNSDNKFIMANDAYLNLINKKKDDVLNKFDINIFSEYEALINAEKDSKILSSKSVQSEKRWIPGTNKKKYGHIKRNYISSTGGVICSIVDTTKQQEEKERTKSMLNSIDTSVCVYKMEGTNDPVLTHCNEETFSLFGISKSDFKTNNFFMWSYIHPDDFSICDPAEIFDPNLPHNKETRKELNFRIILAGGKIKHVKGRIIANNYGNTLYVCISLTDITKDNRANNAKNELEEAVEAGETFVWTGIRSGNGDFKYTYMSSHIENIFKINRMQLHRNTMAWLDKVHPDDKEKAEKHISIKNNDGFAITNYRIIIDEQIKYIKHITKISSLNTNKEYGWIRDITEEIEQKNENILLRNCIEKISDFVWIGKCTKSDFSDFKFIYLSDGVNNVYGVTKEEMLKNPNIMEQAIYEPDRAAAFKEIWQFEFPKHFTFRIKKKDGSLIKVLDSVYRDEEKGLIFGSIREWRGHL
jgi:PAS domain-containing protein